jgi:hypothetical protein
MTDQTFGEYDDAGRRHGAWRQADARGATRLSCTFEHGEPHGELRRFHPNGAVLERGRYEEGRREGVFEAFYDDGSCWYRYAFERDRPVGVWEIRHPGGSLSRRFDWAIPDDEAIASMERPSYDGGEDRRVVARVDIPPRRPGLGVMAYSEELGGVAWLGPAGPELLLPVDVPALRPLVPLSLGAGGVVDMDMTPREGFDDRHRASFLTPTVLAGVSRDALGLFIGSRRERLAELAEVAGDEVTLPPLVRAISDVRSFESDVEFNGVEGAAYNWGTDRLATLASGYEVLGDNTRAQKARALARWLEPATAPTFFGKLGALFKSPRWGAYDFTSHAWAHVDKERLVAEA